MNLGRADDGTYVPIFTRPDAVFYLDAPDGSSALTLPAGTTFVAITADASKAWFQFGDASITTDAPIGPITDGSAPELAPAGVPVYRAVRGVNHLAVQAAGGVVVATWK